MVVTSRFTKYKAPSHGLEIRLVVPCGKTRYSYKIEDSCYLPSADK